MTSIRISLIRIFLLAVSGVCAFAQSHSATLTWTNAASNPSGTTTTISRLTGTCPSTPPQTPTSGGFASIITGLASTVATYIDTTVTAGASYCYVAFSVNAGATSGPSNTAGATVPTSFPPQMFSVSVN